jgi:hypothetical protein
MSTVTVDKAFAAKFKLYLTSISANRAPYCYFNIVRNGVVLSNSTSSGKGIEHGDRLMDFAVGEVSLHFVIFKDLEFYQKIRELLMIPEEFPYCVHVTKLMAVINGIKNGQMDLFYDGPYLIAKKQDTQEYQDKNKVGFLVTNFHVQKVLSDHAANVQSLLKRSDAIEQDVDISSDLASGVYFVTLDITKLGLDKVFKHVRPTLRLAVYDGLSTPAIKTFLSKLKQYILKRYIWTDGKLIYTYVKFEDDVITDVVLRPNVVSMPIIDDVKFAINQQVL